MAFQLSHPQGKMYKAARRRYLFLFPETANPLKGCWCLERECLWAEMGKKEGGLGWGGDKMELGALNRREGGGREYVFDSKRKKKVNSVPLFFVEHLALTLPCFLYSLPPPPPPQLIHTQPHRVQQICRISHQRAFSIFCTEMHAS